MEDNNVSMLCLFYARCFFNATDFSPPPKKVKATHLLARSDGRPKKVDRQRRVIREGSAFVW